MEPEVPEAPLPPEQPPPSAPAAPTNGQAPPAQEENQLLQELSFDIDSIKAQIEDV
jgi:hypothetical protein